MIKELEKNYEIIKKQINEEYEFYINRFKDDYKFSDEDIKELLFIFETRHDFSYNRYKKYDPYRAGKEAQAIRMSNIYLRHYLDKHLKNKKNEINNDFEFDFISDINFFYRAYKSKEFIFDDDNLSTNYAYFTEDHVSPDCFIDRCVVIQKTSLGYHTFELLEVFEDNFKIDYDIPDFEKEKLLENYGIKL